MSICLLCSGYIRRCSIRAICRRISLFSILLGVFHEDLKFSYFQVFLGINSSSSCVNCPSLMSTLLLMIFVITELTVSTIDPNKGILCVQEHRYLQSEDIKCHDTGNGWTFVSAYAWKISVKASIGSVCMLIGLQALKSLNI